MKPTVSAGWQAGYTCAAAQGGPAHQCYRMPELMPTAIPLQMAPLGDRARECLGFGLGAGWD